MAGVAVNLTAGSPGVAPSRFAPIMEETGMRQHLLVPLDGTGEAAAALTAAETLATLLDADLTLLRVVPTGERDPLAHERLLTDARSYLTVVAQDRYVEGRQVETMVREGDAATAILSAAAAREIDLVVMATHARAGLNRLRLGSVAEKVVAHSQTPVLLVRPDTPALGQLRTLLVPVDGSAGSAMALGAATGVARATGARLVLVEAVVPIPLYLYAHPFPAVMDNAYVDPAWEEEARASAAHYVDGLAQGLRQKNFIVEAQVVEGEAAKAIVDVADQRGVDLIVMSTHGATGLERTLLGSVAADVVRLAHQPVLLLRQPATATVTETDTDPAATVQRLTADMVPANP